MMPAQMWKRLEVIKQRQGAVCREKVVIVSIGAEETKAVDALVERWMAGEPMERYGGAYDEERMDILRVIGVRPGEI